MNRRPARTEAARLTQNLRRVQLAATAGLALLVLVLLITSPAGVG